MISGLHGETYEDKLTELKLEKLSKRRVKLELIQTLKILHGFDRVDPNIWFNTFGQMPNTHSTRLSQHPLNLKLPVVPRTEIRLANGI